MSTFKELRLNIERRIEKKVNDVISFKNFKNNIIGKIAYLKNEKPGSLKKNKKCESLSTNLKSFDIFVIIAETSSSITIWLTRIGLIVIPVSIVLACGLTISTEILNEINRQKYKKYKKTM